MNRRLTDLGDADLLGLDALDAHAKGLAARLSIKRRSRFNRASYMHQLRNDTRALRRAYTNLVEDVRQGEPSPAAAEWLLDNFHVITAAVRDVQHDLPASYFRRLPVVAGDEFADFPRIFVMAGEIVRRSAGHLDGKRLHRFVEAFQSIAPLTLAELWAWPSALKLALIQQLRSRADSLMASRSQRQDADRLVHSLDGSSTRHQLPRDVHPAFAIRLLQRLRERGVGAAALRHELDAALAARGQTLDDAIRSDAQSQSREQASMANLIGSLALVSSFDWSEFFEGVSLVEQVLQRDPAGLYGQMDFRSRDRYRQAVEDLAEQTGDAQVRIALTSVERARQGAQREPENPHAHVGYYLIGRGRRQFEEEIGWRRRLRQRARGAFFHHATLFYLGAIVLGTSLLVSTAVAYANEQDARHALLTAVALLVLVPASEVAIQIVQRIAAAVIPPRRLPRLDLTSVPAAARTMVIVPVIIDSVEQVNNLIAHLEVQAVGNQDAHIHFAILSDCADADAQTLPGDEGILDAARTGIESLNRKHARGGGPRFFLFHRTRGWNQREGRWMGWERSAERSKNSIAFFAEHPTRASACRWGISLCCRTCVTASRSIATLGCRAIQRGSSSASSLTR